MNDRIPLPINIAKNNVVPATRPASVRIITPIYLATYQYIIIPKIGINPIIIITLDITKNKEYAATAVTVPYFRYAIHATATSPNTKPILS